MSAIEKHALEIIGQCLQAVAHGPFLVSRCADDPWWEFHPLMGLFPQEFADIADRWPDVEFDDAAVQLAVNNAMNNLLGYPHRCEVDWPEFISAPPSEVARILTKWRELIGQTDGPSSNDYDNRIM